MFSFLKGRTAPDTAEPANETTPTVTTPTVTTSEAEGSDAASAAAGPASADADHPLAAMVWDSPDVPPSSEPAAGAAASHGLDVGALVAPPASSDGPGFGEKDQARTDALKPQIVDALSTIYDPEIPVNIYELGLIYDIVADADSRVTVTMTLTSPACPSAQQLPSEARYKTKAVEGVTDAYVDVVWEPAWTKELMSETAKMALGMF